MLRAGHSGLGNGYVAQNISGQVPGTEIFYSIQGNILRPGQYAKVRTAARMLPGAILAPQRAISELQGSYQVAVVDSANKVSIRNVKVGDRVGTMWIINEGLKPGERVVAEGVQKVRPDSQVNPKPFVPSAADRKAA